MRTFHIERVPAHVRDFQIRIARRDAIDLAGNPAEPFLHLVFQSAFGQKLHADANTEERPPFPAHGLFKRFAHPINGIEPALAIGKRTDPRQHHAVGLRHDRRIAGDNDRLIDAAVARRALERLRCGVQVTRAVIDNGDAHRPMPGCGKSPMMSDVRGKCGFNAGATATGAFLSLCSQVSKKRRSAASRSSPATTPEYLQPRRWSVKRRSELASSPISNESKNPTQPTTNAEAPANRMAASSANETTMVSSSTSHMRCRNIHNGPKMNAQNENPSRTKT